MKYTPYYNTTLRYPGSYDNYVMSYLKENSGKTPYDFLSEKINELQELIKELNNWSEVEEKNKLVKEEYEKEKPTFRDSRDVERWINRNLDQKKQSIKRDLNIFKNNLRFLELKMFSVPKPIKLETIDLSNTKGTEKIIMLKQLGILDFLKEKQPFNVSTNALASALSGITGIKTDTLQSYINPIDNPSVNQKNNPLKKEKSVTKINQKLISIGFNPPK